MDVLLLWIAKILQKLSRIVGNSGAALPGLLIERVSPDFLEHQLAKLPGGVIVISGTNGKTTTTKMVADVLKKFDVRVMSNTTGSNMTRGLIAAVVSVSTFTGKLPYDMAVLEVDEAYAAVLARRLPIRAALVLNVMRDQLDRFGEIDKTAELLSFLTKKASDVVVLNAGDGRVANLPVRQSAKRVTFALDQKLIDRYRTDDDWHRKAAPLKPKRLKPDYSLTDSAENSFTVTHGKQLYTFQVNFDGIHNDLNMTAAFAFLCALLPKQEPGSIKDALEATEPAFGRGEKILLPQGSVTLLLVKNPSSFVTTLAATEMKKYDSISIVINDAYADSRDVSWLWDVNVASFRDAGTLMTAGTRAYDMAVRLKYEDIQVDDVMLGVKPLIQRLGELPGHHAVFCTYTAMLDLRKKLVRQGHVRQVV